MTYSDPLNLPPERPPLQPYAGGVRPIAIRWAQAIKYGFIFLSLVVVSRMFYTNWFVPHQFAEPTPSPAEVALDEWFVGSKKTPEPAPALALRPAPETTFESPPLTRAEEPSAANVVKSTERRRQLDRFQSELDSWQRELDQWQRDVVPLLTNDAGKSLVPDYVAKFRAVYEAERPTSRLKELRQDADVFARHLQLDASGSLLGNDQDLYALEKATSEAHQATVTWQQARSMIAAMLHASPVRAAQGPTLAAALTQLAERDRLEQAQQVEQAREQVRQATNAKLAAAAAETERLQLAAKEAAVAREQDLQRLAIEHEQHQMERARLEAALDRDMIEVKRYLAPFLADGYAQPHGYCNEQTATLGPMSYSKIRAAGALNSTRPGMTTLIRYATERNDRDKAGFPICVTSQDSDWAAVDKEYVRRAQELLTRYGDLLVERKLLAP